MFPKKRIYINAPNIRHGGGLILLEMILKAAQSLDFSISGNLNAVLKEYEDFSSNNKKSIEFSESGLSNYLFPIGNKKQYLQEKEQICLYFGNLPPISKTKGTSVLYIHNKLLLEPVFKYKLNFKTRFRLVFEKLFIILFYKNVDFIVVQTPSMKRLSNKILKRRKTISIPFFDFKEDLKEKNQSGHFDFFYPSYGYTYKNHKNLILAFNLLSKKNIFPTIVMALDSKIDNKLIAFIREQIKKNGLKIKLVLDQNFEDMNQYYNSCDALVWPSLTDSLGMPLIEASAKEKDILASDLEYIHDILEIKKEDCFNPYDPLLIADCLENYLSKQNKEVKNHEVKIKIFTSKEFLNKLTSLTLK